MESITTRRAEMGLPILATLDLGLLLEAQGQLERGDFRGVNSFLATLGAAGKIQAIRKLATIATATDDELKAAEEDPQALAQLEERGSAIPYGEAFKEAVGFFTALLSSLRVSLTFSGPGDQAMSSDGPALQ
jgi:hypothetical protein